MNTKNIGIYQIRNIKNNKIYIGSSINLKKRKYQHFYALKNNTHHSIKLQRAYNKYNKDDFKFEILKFITNTSLLLEIEQQYIDKYNTFKKGYNCSPSSKKPYKYIERQYKEIKNNLETILEKINISNILKLQLNQQEKAFIFTLLLYVDKKGKIKHSNGNPLSILFIMKYTKTSKTICYKIIKKFITINLLIKNKDKSFFLNNNYLK